MNSYFVILLEEEGSYSTVHHSDVICDESVEVGDSVTFFWNRKKHEGIVKYMGEEYDDCVQVSVTLSSKEKPHRKNDSFHEDQPRKSALRCKDNIRNNANVSKRKKAIDRSLQSQPKKVKSTKRKSKADHAVLIEAAKKMDKELMEMINETTSSKAKKANHKQMIYSDDETEATDDRSSEKATMPATVELSDDSGSDQDEDNHSLRAFKAGCGKVESTDDDSQSSNGEEETSEQKKKRKLYEKLVKDFDIETLQNLLHTAIPKTPAMPSKVSGGKSRPSSLATDAVPSTSKESTDFLPSNSSKGTEAVLSSPKRQSESVQSTLKYQPGSALGLKKCKPNPVAADVTKSFDNVDNPGNQSQGWPGFYRRNLSSRYSGDMFRVKDPVEEEARALDKNKTIFCEKDCYSQAENSKSATTAARRLLEGVFTIEALASCSITGMPPRGKGKAAYADKNNIKPYLDVVAVSVIIDEVQKLIAARHWKPKKDRSQIRQAMGVRLSEIAEKVNNGA